MLVQVWTFFPSFFLFLYCKGEWYAVTILFYLDSYLCGNEITVGLQGGHCSEVTLHQGGHFALLRSHTQKGGYVISPESDTWD